MKKLAWAAAIALLLNACAPAAPTSSLTSNPEAFEKVRFSLSGKIREGNDVEHRLVQTLDGFFSKLNSGNPAGLAEFAADGFAMVAYYDKDRSKTYDLKSLADFTSNPDLGLYFFGSNLFTPTQFKRTSNGKLFVAIRASRQSAEFSRDYVMFATLDDAGAMLEQLIVQPVLKTEFSGEAKIFVIKNGSPGDIINRWPQTLKQVGPDGAVNTLRSADSGGVTRDESNHSVVFVFSKPLPLNAKVRVEHQFRLTREDRWLNPYKFSYSFEEAGDFQMIESFSRAGGPKPRTITYRVFVNGEKVGERTVETY